MIYIRVIKEHNANIAGFSERLGPGDLMEYFNSDQKKKNTIFFRNK